MKLRNCVVDLLKRGQDDWIQAAEIASVARTVGGATTEEEARDLSLRVLRELLGRNLMEVGMVAEEIRMAVESGDLLIVRGCHGRVPLEWT